mmetsp:Transcript_6788/g.15027  ORF Transcript_6788/g.15027 Transcript_6788/m.15027 type:complete len:382 (-) Transcript_6788:349-1494(-)
MATEAFGKAHVPYGKDGEGLYSTATLGCFNVVQAAGPMALEALKQSLTASSPSGHMRICDFGCADAGTSMPLLNQMVAAVKESHSVLEVEVSYEDQPNNDFKSLFFHTQGIRPIAGVEPLANQPGVFVTASGTSFFKQGFPSSSVHLVTSFTAMHWLSRQPSLITGGIHMTQLRDAQEKSAWAAQAAADWELILINRAKELVPGGRAVLVNFCVSPDGHWLGHTDIGPCMFGTMDRLWCDMAKEGRITQQEYEHTAFINYYRNEQELLAPFQPGSAAHAAGLRLVSHSFRVVRCPFREAWVQGKSAGGSDALAHAKWYVPTLRTWSNSTFTSGLSAERPAAEKAALADELFQRYEQEVAAAPELHGMDYVHCYMHIEKVSN